MFERETKLMAKAIKKLGKIFLQGADEKTAKGSRDYVTDKDLKCEEILINTIKKYFPKDNIVSEETNKSNVLADRTWIIDPIDGTLNFMNYLPECGIQVAFYAQGESQLSFIYLPKLDEFYFAKNGGGAYLNGKQIVVNKNLELDQCMVSFSDHKVDEKLKKAIAQKVMSTRLFGSACYSFAKTASSSTAAYLIANNNLWDYMPGMLLCKEAGCTCTSGEIDGTTYNLACCNENLSKFITREIKKMAK